MKRSWPLHVILGGFFLVLLSSKLDGNSSRALSVSSTGLLWISFVLLVLGSGAGLLRRGTPLLLRLLSGLLLLFVLAEGSTFWMQDAMSRRSALGWGKKHLKEAKADCLIQGYFTNHDQWTTVWRSSNVVSIGGTQHQCFLTVRESSFRDQGTLAITTNDLFIWLDKKHGPKVIDERYFPPLYSSRF